MTSQSNKPLLRMLYPYMFMLKEGPEIKGNPFDYSLLIVLTKSETLQSPGTTRNPLSFEPATDIL